MQIWQNSYFLECARKLNVLESELERSEDRVDKLSIENARLKEEVRQLSNERKSFEASDEQFSARETHVSYVAKNWCSLLLPDPFAKIKQAKSPTELYRDITHFATFLNRSSLAFL